MIRGWAGWDEGGELLAGRGGLLVAWQLQWCAVAAKVATRLQFVHVVRTCGEVCSCVVQPGSVLRMSIILQPTTHNHLAL